jgi:hypothetical protein
VLLLAVGITAAFSDALAPGRGLLYRDHGGVFRPLFWNVQQEILSGHLPALTRFSRAGVPAEQSFAAFSLTPATVILLLGDLDRVYELFVIFHFLVLSTGVLVLSRSLGASRPAALFAAAIGGLSGPVLSQENLLTNLSGLTWAPWVLWSFLRILRSPSTSASVLFAFAIAFQVQGLIPTFLVLDVAAALVLLIRVRPRFTRALALALGFGALLGVALAAVELFPLLEILPSTARGRGFSADELNQWSLRPAQLFDLVAPAIWAPPELPFAVVSTAVGSSVAPYLTSLYLGPALAIVALGAWPKGPDRRMRLALAAGALLALVIASGDATPLHGLLARLPLLKSERYPVKYVVIAAAFSAALAPAALERAAARPRAMAIALSPLIVVLGAAWWALGSPEVEAWLGSSLDGEAALRAGLAPTPPAVLAEAMRARVLHALAASAILGVAAVLFSRIGNGRDRFRWTVAAITVFDLALAGRWAIAGARLLRGPSELERLAGERDPNLWLYPASPSGRHAPVARHDGATAFDDLMRSVQARGYTAYRSARVIPALDNDAQANPLLMSGYGLLAEAKDRDRALRLLGRLGVAWIGQWTPEELPGVVRYEVEGEAPEYAIPNPHRIPYARAFSSWAALDPSLVGPRARLERITDPANDGTAFLLAGGVVPPAAPCNATTAAVTAERAGEVEVDVRTACPVLVAVREVMYPGWTATLDGRGIEIVQADFGFLGAFVPPGEHRLSFRYASRSAAWARLSIAALAIAAVGCGGDALRRARLRRAAKA